MGQGTEMQATIKTIGFSNEDLEKLNDDLKLGAGYAGQLRMAYDNVDLSYMMEHRKEPPTAKQLSIAFGKYAYGLRLGDDGWTAMDEDALKYATGGN